MEELENYEINIDTLLIIPISNGMSKVYEYGGEYIVKKTPLKIIENSCLFFGSSYEGRKEGTKSLIGIDMKVPIIIEDSKNIIFFPISSCIRENSIWVSFQNIIKYSKKDDFSTLLVFKNNYKITIQCKYNLIDNQMIRCIKLERVILTRKKFLDNECLYFEES